MASWKQSLIPFEALGQLHSDCLVVAQRHGLEIENFVVEEARAAMPKIYVTFAVPVSLDIATASEAHDGDSTSASPTGDTPGEPTTHDTDYA